MSNGDYDEGVTIYFEGGMKLRATWNGCEGHAELNDKRINVESDF